MSTAAPSARTVPLRLAEKGKQPSGESILSASHASRALYVIVLSVPPTMATSTAPMRMKS